MHALRPGAALGSVLIPAAGSFYRGEELGPIAAPEEFGFGSPSTENQGTIVSGAAGGGVGPPCPPHS